MAESLSHITTSGGLLSAAFVESIREEGARLRGVEPESFALPWSPAPKGPAALEETIATAWELLKERWDAVRADILMLDVGQVRTRWVLPLLQLLDFQPVYQRGDTLLDPAGDLRFPISHRGWQGDGAPAIHIVAPGQDLDARVSAGRGIKAKSPHDMLQVFLNSSPVDHWAILTNGISLRLLRDFHHTFTKGYVQFDLESIFETRNYGDFRALYRLCHASRFVPQGGENLPVLELFYKDSIATGIKVGDDLREQVRRAIETLGNGFLGGDLIQTLQRDPDACRAYYGEILQVVYRILFLLFAEQRGMIPRVGAPLEDLYRTQYSLTALRARAEGDIPREDEFTDLWEGLKVTFRMVREGAPELGIFAYDGMLFEDNGHSWLRGRTCPNSALLHAVRALTLVEREGVLQRISYADLGVEELGSVYESLLDFTPRVSTYAETVDGRDIPASTFFLDPRGQERKTTGSYYTHPSLVNELIKSALLPVARDRLAQAGLPVVAEDAIGEATAGLLADYAGLTPEQRAAGEAAILNIKVCDPAAGSGHFLVKANDALGVELARIRAGEEYPPETLVQAAKRDVLAHCIYGVDLNPMAVELCKVSLWINASERDKPLNFLDHHIKCGNSLVGATPDLLDEGVPDDAFQPVTGDDERVAAAIRKRNREERAGQMALWQMVMLERPEDLAAWRDLTGLAETDPRAARDAYRRLTTSQPYEHAKLAADVWTAAFFWPLKAGDDVVPTHEALRQAQADPRMLPPEFVAEVERLARRYRFFHWHLEFPDVFSRGVGGGFDVVLGNPPWERVKLQEKEFFAERAPEIANAPNAAARRRLIAALPQTNPALAEEYRAALRASECESKFIRNSGRFPRTGVGDVNVYAVFAELARSLIGPRGRAGIIVPSGIATDYTYRDFFADLMDTGSLISLYDFENRPGLFPGTHRSYKYCLLTLCGREWPRGQSEFAFFLHMVDDLADPDRRFTLSPADLALFNPNTRTCPIFRARRDAELTRKLYRAAPVLHNEATGENPWGISFLRMFDMTNDSHLFRTREQLEAQGFALKGNRFVRGDEVYLPLYEAKMFWHYDHRFGTYEGVESRSDTHLPTPTPEQHADPAYVPQPWYWVAQREVAARMAPKIAWMLAFRNVTNTTNERTGIFALQPRCGAGNSAPILHLAGPSVLQVCMLVANLAGLVLDFVVRQKMGGVNFNFFIVEQIPILPPDRYTPDLLAYIVPRVLELTYTAWDLRGFADDVWRDAALTPGVSRAGRGEDGANGRSPLQDAILRQWEDNAAATGGGHAGAVPPDWAVSPSPCEGEGWGEGEGFPRPPFKWDEERRFVLRAELDALYAHLYGLTRDELAYILDTFPIVRRKDEEKYGEYRTKRVVLEKYEELQRNLEY